MGARDGAANSRSDKENHSAGESVYSSPGEKAVLKNNVSKDNIELISLLIHSKKGY